MIAVVSSTLFPGQSPLYGGTRSHFTDAQRLEQTRATVASLVDAGYRHVFVADNSPDRWPVDEGTLHPATVQRFRHQHQFRNKGISELFLLRSVVEHLPADVPIVKLSGRYRIASAVDLKPGDADVSVKWDSHGGISTRCYAVRNREVYARFLDDTLNEVYGHQARVRGPRSLVDVVRRSLWPAQDRTCYFDPNESIERAAGRALNRRGYVVRAVDELGIEGEIAVSSDHIRE